MIIRDDIGLGRCASTKIKQRQNSRLSAPTKSERTSICFDAPMEIKKDVVSSCSENQVWFNLDRQPWRFRCAQKPGTSTPFVARVIDLHTDKRLWKFGCLVILESLEIRSPFRLSRRSSDEWSFPSLWYAV